MALLLFVLGGLVILLVALRILYPSANSQPIKVDRKTDAIRRFGDRLQSLKERVRQQPNEARWHTELGEVYLSTGLWMDVVEEMERAAKLGDQSATTLNALGNSYWQLGRPERAIAQFKKNARLHSERVDLYLKLADAYLLTTRTDLALETLREIPARSVSSKDRIPLALAHAKCEDYDTALRLCSEYIRDHPDDLMAFGARGKILLRKRDPVRAESDLEKACRLGPPRAEHLYWLGIVRSRSPSSKKRATAVHLWEKAVRADERYDAAFYRLGLVYQDQGRLKEAAHCFSSAYSLRPRQQMSLLKLSEVYSKTKQFSLAYQSRGAYYRKRGALDQAVEQFRARINVDPHNEQTYIELATTLARENRRAEAIDVLEKGLTFAESKSDLYYLLASTYYDSKDLKKAKDALETMMRLYQDNADSAMRMLAQIAWDERDRDKSERILKKAIRLRPDEAENHYLLGIIYMRRLGKGNRLPLAIKEFERCIELDPRNTQAVYRLGIAYQRAQRWEEAGAQFRAAISIDPSFASPYLNLYKVYRKLNKSTGHLRRLYDEYEESKSEMETLIMRNRARQYDTEATLKLGREYLRNGLINEGEERLVRLVQLAPNSPRAHEELARIYVLQGREEEAEEETSLADRLRNRRIDQGL